MNSLLSSHGGRPSSWGQGRPPGFPGRPPPWRLAPCWALSPPALPQLHGACVLLLLLEGPCWRRKGRIAGRHLQPGCALRGEPRLQPLLSSEVARVQHWDVRATVPFFTDFGGLQNLITIFSFWVWVDTHVGKEPLSLAAGRGFLPHRTASLLWGET